MDVSPESWVGRYLLEMRERVARGELRASSLTSYATDLLRAQTVFREQGLELEDAPTEFLSAYLYEILGSRTARTRAKAASVLRGYFRWLSRKGRVSTDPMLPVPSPRIPRVVPTTTESFDAVRRLVGAVGGEGWRSKREAAVLSLAFGAGLSASEIVRLRPADVDLPGRTVSVAGSARFARRVQLEESVQHALEVWLVVRAGIAAARQVPDVVFVSLLEKPLTRQGLWKTLRKAAASVGIAGVTPRQLRLAHAVRRFAEGRTEKEVAQELGIKDGGRLGLQARAAAGRLRARQLAATGS